MMREPTLEEIQYLITLPFNDSLVFTGEPAWNISIYNATHKYPKIVWITLLGYDDKYNFVSAYLYDENMIVLDPVGTESDESILEWLNNVTR